MYVRQYCAYTKIIAALKFNRPFLQISDNFENVNLFLNANILVTTVLNYTVGHYRIKCLLFECNIFFSV